MIFLSLIREESEAASGLLARHAAALPPFPGIRRRSAVARALLFDLLPAVPACRDRSWRLGEEPGGRPVLLPGTAGDSPYGGDSPDETVPPVTISFSHSGGWVGCAVASGGRIGLDLEAARPSRSWLEIAETAFGPAEIRRVARDGENGFYRIWALREAVAKAEGAGLAVVTDRRDRVDQGPDSGRWTSRQEGALWHFAHWRVGDLFHLAMAFKCDSQGPQSREVELKWWHLPSELRNILAGES